MLKHKAMQSNKAKIEYKCKVCFIVFVTLEAFPPVCICL